MPRPIPGPEGRGYQRPRPMNRPDPPPARQTGRSRTPGRPFIAGRPRNALKRWPLYKTLDFSCCTWHVEGVPWRYDTYGPILRGQPGHRGRRRVWAWRPPCAPASGSQRARKTGMPPLPQTETLSASAVASIGYVAVLAQLPKGWATIAC
jgi:hypothetical protein